MGRGFGCVVCFLFLGWGTAFCFFVLVSCRGSDVVFLACFGLLAFFVSCINLTDTNQSFCNRSWLDMTPSSGARCHYAFMLWKHSRCGCCIVSLG
ncbi:hypothetical protein F5144DRAFT_585634 [Chaetomium tenue]|uniref:Uncharacterized protein n=1 Tax=Chaetomium tenue TaxID=1854479 RepID=A0ACB7NY75_9PEZI|nr:hypothetical protein F5144DRAFT_585634 [Chaetomium globosum]